MKVLLAFAVFMSSSIALADTLECKLVVGKQVARSYADKGEAATVQIGGITCSGVRESAHVHKVTVIDAGGFVYSAQAPGEAIAIIDGGSSDVEAYGRSFCSCSSM